MPNFGRWIAQRCFFNISFRHPHERRAHRKPSLVCLLLLQYLLPIIYIIFYLHLFDESIYFFLLFRRLLVKPKISASIICRIDIAVFVCNIRLAISMEGFCIQIILLRNALQLVTRLLLAFFRNQGQRIFVSAITLAHIVYTFPQKPHDNQNQYGNILSVVFHKIAPLFPHKYILLVFYAFHKTPSMPSCSDPRHISCILMQKPEISASSPFLATV